VMNLGVSVALLLSADRCFGGVGMRKRCAAARSSLFRMLGVQSLFEDVGMRKRCAT
jgi:hypothetical protein